jgi:hypothetical protein
MPRPYESEDQNHHGQQVALGTPAVASLFGEPIHRANHDMSITSLFD